MKLSQEMEEEGKIILCLVIIFPYLRRLYLFLVDHYHLDLTIFSNEWSRHIQSSHENIFIVFFF